MRWMGWLDHVALQTTLDDLLGACRGVQPGVFSALPTAADSHDRTTVCNTIALNLEDIQQAQLADLIAMRMRFDMRYRRHIYVGEIKLEQAKKEMMMKRGIEFIAPKEFEASFQEVR
jgi:hypothetical protein